jgi:hypothetical protein
MKISKFTLGILMGFFVPTILLLGLLQFGINQEDLTFKSKNDIISVNTIKENKNVVICVLSSGCPGKFETTPFLIKNIKKFKQRNITYYIVADELYKNNVDAEIDNFKKEFGLNDKVYLMDINKYTENSGFFNAKRRYKEFVFDLCGKTENFPFGYVNYIFLKNGRFLQTRGFDLTDNDLEIYKK